MWVYAGHLGKLFYAQTRTVSLGKWHWIFLYLGGQKRKWPASIVSNSTLFLFFRLGSTSLCTYVHGCSPESEMPYSCLKNKCQSGQLAYNHLKNRPKENLQSSCPWYCWCSNFFPLESLPQSNPLYTALVFHHLCVPVHVSVCMYTTGIYNHRWISKISKRPKGNVGDEHQKFG